MPWTIPNLILHDKPVRLTNMRSLGRNHVFVNCGNPDCYHNTELDVSRFPDDVTFNDLQPRILCTVCDHRGRRRWPVLAASSLIDRASSTIPFPCPTVANSSPQRRRELYPEASQGRPGSRGVAGRGRSPAAGRRAQRAHHDGAHWHAASIEPKR